ncbi:MAG: GMP/IMP nucleotidase [Gammaproteobacteria bacterium]|nr:GMP/IMP nucleotidase [Gammaproteobacteria bacterium]
MVPWNDIDTVLLDLDGTLLDLHFDTFFWLEHLPRRFAERHNLPLEAAKADVRARLAREAGTLRWYCIDHWSRELGLDVLALKREVEHLITLHAGTEAFLGVARRQAKRLVLTTNAHSGILSVKLDRTGIGHYFDEIVCSHALGAPKEDADFWTRLTDRSPFDPARTLFVDDSLPVLRAARGFGIRFVFAVRQPDTRARARDVGDFRGIDRVSDLLNSAPA